MKGTASEMEVVPFLRNRRLLGLVYARRTSAEGAHGASGWQRHTSRAHDDGRFVDLRRLEAVFCRSGWSLCFGGRVLRMMTASDSDR